MHNSFTLLMPLFLSLYGVSTRRSKLQTNSRPYSSESHFFCSCRRFLCRLVICMPTTTESLASSSAENVCFVCVQSWKTTVFLRQAICGVCVFVFGIASSCDCIAEVVYSLFVYCISSSVH